MSLTHDEAFKLELLVHSLHESFLKKDDVIKLLKKKEELVEYIRGLEEESKEKMYVMKHEGKYINDIQFNITNAMVGRGDVTIQFEYATGRHDAHSFTEEEMQFVKRWLTFEFEEETAD